MLMDGKELARDIKAKIKTEIDNIKKIHNINPMVATEEAQGRRDWHRRPQGGGPLRSRRQSRLVQGELAACQDGCAGYP